MTVLVALTVLVAVWASFTVSASAGLGGSLVLVPTLVVVLGAKEGVALAALLLAGNNVAKLVAYRRTLPLGAAATIVVMVMIGASLGSSLLVRASELTVTVAVLAMFTLTLAIERVRPNRTGPDRERPQAKQGGDRTLHLRRGLAPLLALISGASSGFSGTSGPLKGVAIRNLNLDRRHFVGAASLVSFAGDATKTAVFAEADLLGRQAMITALAAVPLMVLGTWTGSTLNQRASERAFGALFWTVMAGYTVRLLLLLP